MGRRSAIEWTDATWNPWQGCHRVSRACDHCYMYREKKRYGQDPAKVVRSKARTFNLPTRLGRGTRVFTCSWSDFFIEEADAWRREAWAIMRATPDLRYLVLTKRPKRILDCLPPDWGKGWPHVWLGITAEDGATYSERWPLLAHTPAVWRFVSAEPMLGPIDINRHAMLPDWVICGGESGPDARATYLGWVRALLGQCQGHRIPFFFKQWGEWVPGQEGSRGAVPMGVAVKEWGNYECSVRWGINKTGRKVDGRLWSEFPKELEHGPGDA